MPLLTVIHETTCPACGAETKGVYVNQFRINKSSLRSVGTGLGIIPQTCTTCAALLPDLCTWAVRLNPDDQAKVDAYRARKGWARGAVAS